MNFQMTPSSSDFQHIATPPSDAFQSSEAATSKFNEFQVFVEAEKTIALMVDDTDTVRDLKMQVRAKVDIHPSDQRLIFNNRDMTDDSKTMAEYNVKKHSFIKLLFKMEGGGKRARVEYQSKPEDPERLRQISSTFDHVWSKSEWETMVLSPVITVDILHEMVEALKTRGNMEYKISKVIACIPAIKELEVINTAPKKHVFTYCKL